MAKTLEAHDKLIREIFEGSYHFQIPDYQRPYAWTTEQATELFDDLYSAMQDARVSGTSSQYFLGSIVLIKEDRDPKSFVVDGQQRLSTLTMLFAVLRLLMPASGAFITKYLYKEGNPDWGESNEYRLQARCQRRFSSDPLSCLIAEVNLTHPGSFDCAARARRA